MPAPGSAQYERRPVESAHGAAAGVRALMRSLELRYLAMDFLVSHDDQWHLDCNPNGQ